MTYFFYFIFIAFFISCSSRENIKAPVVARVGDAYLRADDERLEKSYSKETAVLLVNKWVEQTILYNKAIEKNFNEDSSLLKKRDVFFKDLVVSSFLEQETASNIKITKEQIREYYLNNKTEFQRKEEELYVEHYSTKDIKHAKTITSFLLTKKATPKETISSSLRSSSYIKKTLIHPLFSKELFNSKNSVVGPIKNRDEYHVFNVLEKYKKGSFVGLDLVSDKIYQRLYKKEEIVAKNKLIDSLKKHTTIYTNPEYK